MEIKRIIKVEDTREWEVVGEDNFGREKFAPISGSGIVSQCHRCGRDHEVHAHVELENGDVVIIGTGCAKGTSVEQTVKKSASTVKTLARVKAEYTRKQELLDSWRAALRAVRDEPAPIIDGPKEEKIKYGTRYRYTVNGVVYYKLDLSPRNVEELIGMYYLDEADRRSGVKLPHFDAESYERRIKKLEKALAQSTE